MDYKERVKELRSMLPVPMLEALELLKENDGDVEKCIYLFKTKSVKYIMAQTECDAETANKHYEIEKFDVNRAISSIREEQYDNNYKSLDDLTLNGLNTISEWVHLNEEKDFPTSLDYVNLPTAIKTMSLIPDLVSFANKIEKAKEIKDKVFAGYSDSNDISDFVRRHQQIDDDPTFQECQQFCRLSLIKIKEEVTRHKRNLIRINNSK